LSVEELRNMAKAEKEFETIEDWDWK